uniref:Uncharacterized protein n=1 Tax=Caenorhabditis japonica TaxID=281687 RepID=A0A8R1I6M3_CAEJA
MDNLSPTETVGVRLNDISRGKDHLDQHKSLSVEVVPRNEPCSRRPSVAKKVSFFSETLSFSNGPRTYYGDSDSTGYCSSSDVSKALSDSQFILRPNTALLSSSYSNCTNYYALDYSENPRGKRMEKGSTITSRTSTISSNTFKSNSMNAYGDDEEEIEDDEVSTIRANSVRHVPMMPRLTSLQHLIADEDIPPQNEDLTTLEEVTEPYEDDDEITLDIVPRREYRNSSFRSFPFSYQLMESEMDTLFDMMHDDEQMPSTSRNSNTSEMRNNASKKRLLIREPTSKIYYHDFSESSSPQPPQPPGRSNLARTESVPRSILKTIRLHLQFTRKSMGII